MRTAKYWINKESMFDKHRLTVAEGDRELVLCRESHHISTPDNDWALSTMRQLALLWEESDTATAPLAPAGWTSTEIEIGEVREPAQAMVGPKGCPAIKRGIYFFDGGPLEGHKALLDDLVTAHNAFFRTDPEGDAKLDRELAQALKIDAEKRARHAAVAISDALVPGGASHIVVQLVASLILASQR